MIYKHCDDFFKIGNIAIMQRKTGDESYDFDFRKHFDCKSVISKIEEPVLLHLGAINNYAEIEADLEEMGMRLLVHEAEHDLCSMIEGWYPAIKDKTPYTKIYDKLPDYEEVIKDSVFPIFVKGNRQTNKHMKSQCIINNRLEYDALRKEWSRNHILNWQKAAIREYVPLQTVDATSYPNMVPISYEYRFFYFEGKCMAYGPYWNMGKKYDLNQDELTEVLRLTDWAADRLGVSFPAIDVAKTATGEWIVIEVNDAQESGFVGLNPLILWKNTIDAMQERSWISVEDFFADVPLGTVILAGDPCPDTTVEEMRELAKSVASSQELVDLYVSTHNKYGYIEDTVYDYEEGTEEYKSACAEVDAWYEIMRFLESQAISLSQKHSLYTEDGENIGLMKRLTPIMDKYGYRDGNGWWIRKEQEGEQNSHDS